MRKLATFSILGLIILLTSGCASFIGGAESNDSVPLTEQQQQRFDRYMAMDSELLVDDVSTDSADVLQLDPYSRAYEGYRVLTMLGLDDILNDEQQLEFVRALFHNLPSDVQVGMEIRNIAVNEWYDDGEPLIVHLTQAYAGEQIPTLVLIFNTMPYLREFGIDLIQAAGPGVEYPHLARTETGFKLIGHETYTILLMENAQVSASSAVTKDLPSFDEMESPNERVNLTDDYLRDGDRSNDDLVVPVLQDVIEDESVEPVFRIHGGMQLFMYYLLSGDLDAAGRAVEEIRTSPLLEDESVKGSDIARAAVNEPEAILEIAIALAEEAAAE